MQVLLTKLLLLSHVSLTGPAQLPTQFPATMMQQIRSTGSPNQQQTAAVQAAGMRCVFCGGPFRCPTHYDRVASCLTGPPAAFNWLRCWRRMSADADKRKRGEPPAFYAHKDCIHLLERKLDITPKHSQVWQYVSEHMTNQDSIPDSLPDSSYLGLSERLQPFGTRSSTSILSPSFKAADSWMLHSPLVCTKNAARLLTIWQPKLDSSQRSLMHRLSSLMLRPSTPRKVWLSPFFL